MWVIPPDALWTRLIPKAQAQTQLVRPTAPHPIEREAFVGPADDVEQATPVVRLLAVGRRRGVRLGIAWSGSGFWFDVSATSNSLNRSCRFRAAFRVMLVSARVADSEQGEPNMK